MKLRRAYSLAAVCALCALALLMLSLALDMMLRTHRQATRTEQYEIALRYAKNAFQLGLVHLRQDPQWHDTLEVPRLPEEKLPASARIHFDPTIPDFSSNRFDQDGFNTTHTGLQQPGHSIHLLSVGRCSGTRAIVEGIIAVKPFPYAIASSGPLVTSGAFVAGSIDDPSVLPSVVDDPIALQKALKRGSLLSNASLSLSGSPVRVTGDVVCAGTASLGPGVVVEGQVREHRDPKPIPSFTLSQFDTAEKPGVRILETNHLTQPDDFEGYVRGSGPVIIDGALRLSEAIVYIDGDLTVRGPLAGRGALFVTGNVVLESTSLGALDQLALIAGRGLTLRGTSQSTSRLVGLLVSLGDLSLSDVTLVGALLCAGDHNKTLKLHNVAAYASPKGLQFEFALGWGVPTQYQAPPDPISGTGGGLVRLAQVTDPDSGEKRNATPADFVGRYDASHPNAPLLRASDFEVVLADGSVTTLAGAGIPFNNNKLKDNLMDAMNSAARHQAQAAADQTVSEGKLSLDLNKFLRVGDSLQVVYRRIDI